MYALNFKCMRDSMIFYRSFYEAINELNAEQQGILYGAIFAYGLNNKQPELSGICKTVWTLIKPQLDANLRKFDNGKKGGRPQKNNLNETKPKPKNNLNETKPKANVNDNVNVNNNYNYNVNVNENNNVINNNLTSNGSDYLLNYINETFKKEFKPLTRQERELFNDRLKEGYIFEDFIKTIDNLKKDEFCNAQKYSYVTPEYISRRETIQKFSTVSEVTIINKVNIPM